MQPPMDLAHVSTILVVDDQALNRELLLDTLTDQGFKVLCASNGAEALRLVGEVRVDLVLLDVLMPGKSGFEVCRELKSNVLTQLIPVIFITVLSDRESRIKGIHAGADDLLSLPVDRIELLARIRSLLRLKQRTDELESAESVLFTLALIVEGRDPTARGHGLRISRLSKRLGEYLGLPVDQLTALRLAGVVHDIGKINLPDSILLKPGPLSSEEWTLMREHPAMGERICAPLKSFRLVLPIIRHHHEKRDGTGYPDGLRAAEIPLAAQILQVVDAYDKLTEGRQYRGAISSGDAIRTMKEEMTKGWWDPGVLHAFEHLLEGRSPDLQVI